MKVRWNGKQLGFLLMLSLGLFVADSSAQEAVEPAEPKDFQEYLSQASEERSDAASALARAGKIQFKPIREVSADFRLDMSKIPTDVSDSVFQGTRRPSSIAPAISEFQWTPTNFFHYPLYFDDTPLERYGQTICPPLQPVISGTRFFITLPIIPYKLGVRGPWECVTTSGLMRPGECNPCVRERLTVDFDGALLQTGTVLALVFLFP